MIKAGIVGFGVMGKTHCKCYQSMPNVEVTAICDSGNITSAGTNQASANLGKLDTPLNIENVRHYTDFNRMLAAEKLDALSIALPTYMHADFTVKALEAGVHVLCEKPMALTLEDCLRMMEAAEKTGKILQIGHCLRFWPEYTKAKEIIDSQKYGDVKAASFQRLSAFPTWSWNNWQKNGSNNGGAMFDLHIHDIDIIQHWFGLPKSVFCSATTGITGEYEHIATQYSYPDAKVVSSEASWLMAPSYGFRMTFTVVLEKATVVFDSLSKPTLKLYTFKNQTLTPLLNEKDGYWMQIDYFVRSIHGERLPVIITPRQSYDAVRLALAEKTSARKNQMIDLSAVNFRLESENASLCT